MEVNKEQAEKCRDLGAAALRQGDYAAAAKMLLKSLRLYPLPGVEALYAHAKAKLDDQQAAADNSSSNHNNTTTPNNSSSSSGRTSGSSSTATNGSGSQSYARSTGETPQNNSNNNNRNNSASSGADGRAYSADQVHIVRKVLAAKEGGRGAHYRVLDISSTATEGEIKKAYRKLSLKVHPDKNSAPHAAEAFKAVGLAYATLSDPQKRTIYDRYGEEDPDNRGGGGGGGGHMRHRTGGQEMSPEDIFNAFFGGGGMPGGPGVHFYSTGFGPAGVHFRAGGGGGGPRRGGGGQQQRGAPEESAPPPGLGMLLQLLPIMLFMVLSFLSHSDSGSTHGGAPSSRPMAGENQYFSLTNKPPFTNPMATRLSKVKEIPYFVTDKFLRTYYRDRYQLSQVEHMVERAYENYLFHECKAQREYKKRLLTKAESEQIEEEKTRQLKLANEFELSRCDELIDLFPERHKRTA